mmetsp:Transcript_25344/g.81364  ORF Transcript_25344/g.81364 Transcript_25344/m.81364 type:complete len:290 (+) Transcript_25344:522-1391(+)
MRPSHLAECGGGGVWQDEEEAGAGGDAVGGDVGGRRREADDEVESEGEDEAEEGAAREAARLKEVQHRHHRLQDEREGRAGCGDSAREGGDGGGGQAARCEEDVVGQILERLHHEEAGARVGGVEEGRICLPEAARKVKDGELPPHRPCAAADHRALVLGTQRAAPGRAVAGGRAKAAQERQHERCVHLRGPHLGVGHHRALGRIGGGSCHQRDQRQRTRPASRHQARQRDQGWQGGEREKVGVERRSDEAGAGVEADRDAKEIGDGPQPEVCAERALAWRRHRRAIIG